MLQVFTQRLVDRRFIGKGPRDIFGQSHHPQTFPVAIGVLASRHSVHRAEIVFRPGILIIRSISIIQEWTGVESSRPAMSRAKMSIVDDFGARWVSKTRPITHHAARRTGTVSAIAGLRRIASVQTRPAIRTRALSITTPCQRVSV